MNRYGRGASTIGSSASSSRATASTLCQKCLKRDIHYSFECKTGAQERPYVSRPSRTQQMLNPKLVPKLTSDVPQDLLRKKGIADEQLAKLEQERGRKRDRQIEDEEAGGNPKRVRSASASSVSSYSTGISRSQSRSPRREYTDAALGEAEGQASLAGSQPTGRSYDRRTRSLSARPPPHQSLTDSEKKRRRDSVSSVNSYTSDESRSQRDRVNDRNTRRRYQELSPPRARGRRTESRTPPPRRRLANDRPVGRNGLNHGGPPGGSVQEHRPPRSDRSLSPFSKRLALTQSMNTGGA